MKAMRKFKKGDLFLVLFIGIIALIPLLWSYFDGSNKPSDGLIAVITRDGKSIREIDLNKLQEPQTITLEDGIKVTILAEKGRIRVLDADCPDKICVKAGWLTKPGDRAVCLPSKTIVRIEGEGKMVGLLSKQVIIDE